MKGKAAPFASASILLAGSAAGALLLAIPLKLPIGVSYSDVYMYIDAAYRLQHGQLPHIDFIAPVNSLPFLSFFATRSIFPHAQPVIAAQLSYLFLLTPFLLLALINVQRPYLASLVTLTFVALAFLPFNWGDPGFSGGGEIDGFGAYNRSAGLGLYVLVAALWIGRPQTAAAIAIAAVLVVLWYTKVTAFAVGAVLCTLNLWKFTSREAAIVIAGGILGPALQYSDGSIYDYMKSTVWFTAEQSFGEAKSRIASEVRNSAFLIAPAVGLGLAALWSERLRVGSALGSLLSEPCRASGELLRLRSVQFGILGIGAIALESQNTGSQSYAFVLPAVLALVPDKECGTPANVAALCLASFVFLSMLGPPIGRLIGALEGDTVLFETSRFVNAGVSTTTEKLSVAQSLLAPPPKARASISSGLPAELDTSVGEVVYLASLEEGIAALESWIGKSKGSFRTVSSIDFVDLFPVGAQLQAVRGLPIVFDPDRNVPQQLAPALVARWSTADVILVRRCIEIDALVAMATPVLEERRLVPLTPCWDLYPRN
jgi:hypothetical protein